MAEEDGSSPRHPKPNDRGLNDIAVSLRRSAEASPEIFTYNSNLLITKSKFFAEELSQTTNPNSLIEINCSDSNYKHHLDLLTLLHLPVTSALESLTSVKSALGILQASISLQCEEITCCCIQYLEATSWEEKEEEEIRRIVPGLGPAVAMPILARIQPVDPKATKEVFIAAIRFATSGSEQQPLLHLHHPFGQELKTSAQEQIDYMLGEDEDLPLVMADDEVRSEAKLGLSRIYSSFLQDLNSLLILEESHDVDTAEAIKRRILQSLGDIQWLCNTILPKVGSMREFVSIWVEGSENVLNVIRHPKFSSELWALKSKLLELTSKALEAVGYGNVILPAAIRADLVRKWLPYIRQMRPILDSVLMGGDEESSGNYYPYKMDDDMCQLIEGAIVSLVLALPSNYQAEFLADWMDGNGQHFDFPDLSEAFEIWCYRTKSAKRRLVEGGNLESSSNNSSCTNLADGSSVSV